MTTQLALFEYTALDTETRLIVVQEDKEFDQNMSDTGSSFIRACQNLQRIHTALRYKRPGFDTYCESKPGLSRPTAYRMLGVAKLCLDSRHNAIESREAIYLLAAPSTPEDVRLEILERAEQGEVITHSTVREAVSSHTAPAVPFVPTAADYADPYGDDVVLVEDDEPDSRVFLREPDAIRKQQISVITGSSESNEWYTPDHIIDLAYATMGGIDLDPASSPIANDTVLAKRITVLAKRIYTQADDGLRQPWHGRVWLNPPYGKEEGESETNAQRWSKKLISEYQAGRVTSALLLVKAALGYTWFEDLWVQYPTCLLRKRLSFVTPDGDDSGQAKHATAILYLGEDVAAFRRAFLPFGRIVMPEIVDEP